MSFDEGLAERIRSELANEAGVVEKKMFGGICFLVSGNMCCGVVGDTLVARVGPDQYVECLKLPHAREMDFTGKPMKSMVYVDPEGFAEDDDLSAWLNRCIRFIDTLPRK
jgi:TfoX/Sxy family transcriptional regulator of competence genes